MSSRAAQSRDFQWTTYEKPRAPPPLPSLPPWAQAQPPAAASVPVTPQAQPAQDAGGGWRRPTSYFGAMKRLPAQVREPQEPADDDGDNEDEERRRYRHHTGVVPPPPQAPVVRPEPHHYVDQVNQSESGGGRREWRFGGAAETRTTNQCDDDDAAEQERGWRETPPPPLAAVTPPPMGQQQPELGDAPRAESSPVGVNSLATQEAYFRPWKRSDNNSNNNNNHGADDGGGEDGEPSTVNKWKVRALLNPFAKRKTSQKATVATVNPAPPPTTWEPEQQTQDATGLDGGENPAAPSPPLPSRATVQRTPPAPRRQSAMGVAPTPAPFEGSQPSAPLRPRTPTLAPAPVAVMAPHPWQQQPYEAPIQAATLAQRRPSRTHIRSRETVVLPHLAPPGGELPLRLQDDAPELPVALANISDLRRSTAQLAPLEPSEPPPRRGDWSAQRPLNPADNDEDDAHAGSRVHKAAPPKAPTQLQQLKQQHKDHKQKPKKGATLDALNEIQRKREQRRNAQAEEKQRLKTELQQHGDDAGYKFRRLIQRYRDALSASQRTKPAGGAGPRAPTSQRLSVFVRKRPLAKKELKAKGYDILTCLYAAGAAKTLETSLRRELMCHEPKLKVDCSESLENHAFHFDGVFDDDQDNETVYTATVGPLVPFLVQGGGSVNNVTSLTVFAYGQTGSGKTFTMKSIYRQAAADLFARLAASGLRVAVGVSFYEIYMNQVNDLLNLRKRVQLMEDGEGVVQLLGLKEVGITSADELMELIAVGEEARATSANAVHDDSSRSHALLRVTISSADNAAVLARLSMVDLAGSERACDTQSDSKSTRMEGAEINKSLLALKECIRALDRGATHIPFRQSKLTQLLRDSFLCANSKTVMIATVSPCSDSCNHTLNTLRYADRLKEIGAASSPTSALSLAVAHAHKCLVPVETPLSHDGELSARNAQHRSAEHFEAVVHDTTWLLSQALGSGSSNRTAFSLTNDAAGSDGLSPPHRGGSSDPGGTGHSRAGNGSGGEFYASVKTRRQVTAQAQRAYALFRLQRYARAVKDYDACLASEPTSALLHYNRGCAFYAWGKKERAIQDFTRALKLDCKNALYVESRAAVSKELGRFQEAILDYTWLETLRRMARHTKRQQRQPTPKGDQPHVRGGPSAARESDDDDGSDGPSDAGAREPLATMRGSFSMSFSELQATLMSESPAAGRADSSSRALSLATDWLTTEERETQVLEWMVRFLQRSPRLRRPGDVREAAQRARGWSFFRGMDAAMVEQCLEDAEYAHYEGDAVVVEQGRHAEHFRVVLSPTAPFVKNVDAQSGVSKLRELKKLSQGDAVGTDAFAVSFGDGSLRTIRKEIEAAALAQSLQKMSATKSRLRRGQVGIGAAAGPAGRHRSLHSLLGCEATLSMLTAATSSGNDDDAHQLLAPEPASFTSLEPVDCLLLEVDTYRDILHDHEELVLEERVAFLRGCRVFHSCSDDVLTALAAVSGTRVHDPGKDLLRAGDEVAQLCIIKRGVCQVRKTIHVPAHQAHGTKKKKKKAANSRLSPLRGRRGTTTHSQRSGHEDEDDDGEAPASARSATGDGSWVLDNGWMLTNPRLVNTAQGDGKQVPMITQDVNVGILASGQVFGELSVLQPGQPSQVTIHSQTLVEILVFAQSDLARLQVQYHSGTMNALQESLLFHNPPQQKILQLQRDLERWEKHKRGVLGELALQLPSKAQSVLRGAAHASTAASASPMRRRASLVAVPPLSPLTRHKSVRLLHTSASAPGLAR